MSELATAALELQNFCRIQNWQFCFIGGIAVLHWGQARYTKDVNMTLLTGFANEETFVDAFLQKYQARKTGMREFALKNRVLLLQTNNGIGIDIAIAALDFERKLIARAREVEIEDEMKINLCSAEDLIILKSFANRPIDWLDVEGIINRQGKNNLNWQLITEELTPLAELKEEMTSEKIMDKLMSMK